MHTLKFTFQILSVCGVWLPVEWQSCHRRSLCYRFVSKTIIFVTYVMVFLQCFLLFVSEFDIKFLTEILFTFLTAVSVCAKTMNFLMRRGKVIGLADMLLKSCCRPRDKIELEMERKTDEFIRIFSIIFNLGGQATFFCHLIAPLLELLDQRSLPFQIWLSYDLRLGWNYWLTYLAEVLPMVVGILVNVTTDVLVSGFVLQACVQLDYLRHRLSELPTLVREGLRKGAAKETRHLEERVLEQAVRHHDYIIEYTRAVTETFDLIIVEQYFASVLVFSVIVYELSMGDVPNIQKVMAVGYLCCMLAELFSYCWFGNEITLKSMEFGIDIYRIDWTVLSTKSSKTLMLIMLRTTRPVIMRYGHIVILNIDSFKNILKVTYTAFNVLKESTDS